MAAPGLRVIAGSVRSRRLVVPKGDQVRPTKDRVKAAIFSALESRGLVRDAVVLDLFAGSGALGLEALSRGAASATLVEHLPAALEAIRENVAACKFDKEARIVARSVGTFLTSCVSTFDLAFIDPPYEMTNVEVEQLVERLTPLVPGGTLVIERPTRVQPTDKPEIDSVGDWQESWRRTFGDTLVLFFGPGSSADGLS